MFLDLSDTRVHVEQTGDGPALVLLHGFTDAGCNWLPLIPHLSTTHTVITPDARGHGLSARLREDFTLDDLAADVVGVLDGLGIAEAALLGHSMGASTAARVAALHPDRITRVVLEDPPWRAAYPESDGTPNAFETFVRDFQVASSDEQLSLARSSNPDWDQEEIPLWAQSKAQFDLAGFGSHQNIPGPNWRNDVRGLRCPATLITGDTNLGAIVAPNIATEAEMLCPTLKLVHIPGAGHNIRRDQGSAYLATFDAVKFLPEY
jgi:N-formylmaleamate deformylase